MDFKQVFEGWSNWLAPPAELREQIKQVRDARLAICAVCPYYSKNIDPSSWRTCTLCGCPIKAKTSALSTQCPDSPPRWLTVTSEEEENKIDEFLKASD